MAAAFDDTQSNVGNQDARPPSQNHDVQTEYTEKYPPLDTLPAFEQSRTNEKTRATKLANKILQHIQRKQSRTQLKLMRTDYAAQLEICRDMQKQYCRRKGSINDRDMLWQEEIEHSAKLIFTSIQNYMLSSSRPLSAASQSSKADSPNNDFDADLPGESLLFNRTPPSSRNSTCSISSAEFTKALEVEKQQRLQLEKRIQQMEIEEKEKIKRAVEQERLLLASEYTNTNAEEVSRARQNEKKLTEENVKMKTHLQSAQKKHNDLCKTLQQKEQTLEQERFDKNLEKVRLLNKIKEEILKFQCSSNNNPIHQDKGATANPPTSSNPFKAVPNTINFREWTTNNNSSFSSSRDSSDTSRNTSSIFRLPKLTLKPFDGDPKKWPDFIAIFRDLVHSNPSLTITEKMAVLKWSLSQEIRNGLGDPLSSPA